MLIFLFEILEVSSEFLDFVDVPLSDINTPLISNVEYTQLCDVIIQILVIFNSMHTYSSLSSLL